MSAIDRAALARRVPPMRAAAEARLPAEASLVRRLAFVFARDHARGWRRLAFLSVPLVPFLGAATVLVAAAFGMQLDMELGASPRDLVATGLGYWHSFAIGWLLLFAAGSIAPAIAEDAAAGALLLYFVRPLAPRHYLAARWAAAAWVGALVTAVPSLLLGLAAWGALGGDDAATAAWLGLLVGHALSIVAVAIVVALPALGAGLAVRSAARAPWLFGVALLGTVVLTAWLRGEGAHVALTGAVDLIGGLRAPTLLLDWLRDAPLHKGAAAVAAIARTGAEVERVGWGDVWPALLGAATWVAVAAVTWQLATVRLERHTPGRGGR